MKEDYLNWIKKADEDFDIAEYNLEGNKISAAAFFYQQSAEKALKALYIKKFSDILRTHDLFILAKKLKAPKEILEFSKELNPAYQFTRYPDIPETDLDVEKIKNSAIEIIKWVKKQI